MDIENRLPFSKRHGFRSVSKDIVVIEDAPKKFREALIIVSYEVGGFSPSKLREITCNVLRCSPDKNNWSERPNILNEVQCLITDCEWYKVYDVAESIFSHLLNIDMSMISMPRRSLLFQAELNEALLEHGIGWKMERGIIVRRGSESYEFAVNNTKSLTQEKKLLTASSEMEEAIKDISRRPNPDLTGAITHSMAALECVARKVCEKPNETLGAIMSKCRDKHGLPKTLEEAVTKLWGYSSECGRHLREGELPTQADAELVVGISALITAYLCRNN